MTREELQQSVTAMIQAAGIIYGSADSVAEAVIAACVYAARVAVESACVCHEDYRKLGRIDPGCQCHDHADLIRNLRMEP